LILTELEKIEKDLDGILLKGKKGGKVIIANPVSLPTLTLRKKIPIKNSCNI